MRRVVLTLAILAVFAFAADPNGTAKILAIKKYAQGRVILFEGRTPIFDKQPVFDLTIDFQGKKYFVRYESGTGYYPSRWAEGSQIPVRKEKGRFILMNGEEEVPARTVSEHDCLPVASRTVALPQLECP